jgi:hypothetical protein
MLPLGTLPLLNVLPVAIVVAIQSTHCEGVCTYPVHHRCTGEGRLRRDATSIVLGINQVVPEAFEHG